MYDASLDKILSWRMIQWECGFLRQEAEIDKVHIHDRHTCEWISSHWVETSDSKTHFNSINGIPLVPGHTVSLQNVCSTWNLMLIVIKDLGHICLCYIKEIIFWFLPFSKEDTRVIHVYATNICGILVFATDICGILSMTRVSSFENGRNQMTQNPGTLSLSAHFPNFNANWDPRTRRSPCN